MQQRLVFITVALFVWGVAQSCLASAWTQKEKSGQFIGSISFYHSSSFFNENGNKTESKPFAKVDLNPFFEYGMTDDLTVGLSPSFQYIQQKQSQDLQANATFAYGEFFLRRKILEYKQLVVSFQPLVKLPGWYGGGEEPRFGNRQIDGEARLLAGYGFQWDVAQDGVKRPYAGQYHFVSAEIAYRKHIEDNADELRFDTTLGVRPYPGWLVLGQVFSIFALSDDKMASRVFENNTVGFSLVKLQGSMVKQVTDDTSLQVALFKDVWGENTGNGVGGLVSLWYNF